MEGRVLQPPLGERRLPTTDEIAQRRAALETRLRAAAESGSHDPDRLRIVAVTKTWPVEVVRAALAAGITILGESRVQEAESKVAAVPEATWHLVGRLQSNKARRAVRAFSAIHSIDSLELLRRVDGIATEEDLPTQLLLEVNVAGMSTTAGLAATEIVDPALAAELRALRRARLAGLMTIARFGAGEQEARKTFAELRRLRDRLQQASGIGLPELSMGMSADAEAAAAEGATLVRIGTALFGPRG